VPTLTDWVASFAQELAQRIGEKRYRLWFAQQTRFHWQDEQLLIGVPNRFLLEWLQTTFARSIQSAAESVAGHPVQVRFVIDPALFQAQRQGERTSNAVNPAAIEQSGSGATDGDLPDAACRDEFRLRYSASASADSSPVRPDVEAITQRETPLAGWAACHQLRATTKLDEFLVGESNRLAYAAVMRILEAVRQDTAWFGAARRPLGVPLTLFGPHGVGKSHLLQGLAERLVATFGTSRVAYLTAEDFTNQFLQALRQGKLVEFRKRFRSLQALLLDDLQFLEGKRATQEELLHTIEALSRGQRVLVATSDRHPRLLRWLPQLTDRLLGGAVWSMDLPDQDLRRRLLAVKAERLACDFPAPVLDYLAQTVRGNVRELEGALYAVHHYATVQQKAVTPELAQAALNHWMRPRCGQVTLRDVERAVSRVLHLRPGLLRGREKVRSASYPRMIAMYLARKHTGLPYGEIGRYFGGRNHSTVIAAERKVSAWLRDNATLQLSGNSWRACELLELIEREL
jgi:chromosomal replication initiator protein